MNSKNFERKNQNYLKNKGLNSWVLMMKMQFEWDKNKNMKKLNFLIKLKIKFMRFNEKKLKNLLRNKNYQVRNHEFKWWILQNHSLILNQKKQNKTQLWFNFVYLMEQFLKDVFILLQKSNLFMIIYGL